MIQVLYRAIDILEFISRSHHQAAGLAEIADSLKLNRATCANILKTMTDRNLIEQNERKEYCFGPLMYQLTQDTYYSSDLVLAAKEVMESLTEMVNETTLLSIIHKNKRLTIYQVEGDQDLQVKNRTEKEVYETSTGRLLLAFYNQKEREAFIRKKGLPADEVWEEASTKEGLFKQLDQIKEEKIAMQVTRKHIAGLAVPIYRKDKVVASLGLFLPEMRLSLERKKEIIRLMRKSADLISQNLTLGVQHQLTEELEKI